MLIDLRSDTVTKPTEAMLQAMMIAPVGDDVFGEDPSVNQLEELAARRFGTEAALYCPTGTMSNQIAIKCHTRPGDEVICERLAHVYIYEGGGIAFNSGAQVRALEGDRGRIQASQIEAAINADDVHKPRTSLVCLENTSNRGGGSCYDFAEIANIKKLCTERDLKLHLDGARLFNALVARHEKPETYGAIFDSISVCLSKGLGCPVGSILLGNKEFIAQARRVRKVMGGSMRQAGYMAAAGIFALEHHVNRLIQDHQFAQEIGELLKSKKVISSVMPIETNIVIAQTASQVSAKSLAEALERQCIKVIAIAPNQIRLVTHLGITRPMVDHVKAVIHSL